MKKFGLVFAMMFAIVAFCVVPAFAGGFSFYTNGGSNQYALTTVSGHASLYQMQSTDQYTELGFVAHGSDIPVATVNSFTNSNMTQQTSRRSGVMTNTDSGANYQIGAGAGDGVYINSSTYADSTVISVGHRAVGTASSSAGQTVSAW